MRNERALAMVHAHPTHAAAPIAVDTAKRESSAGRSGTDARHAAAAEASRHTRRGDARRPRRRA